ncbi:MAG: CDP-alcohol phosphatidyltransferase family protein [Dehalococcoidia bacterium]|nr:CDP-alcohol phosphatidyltransferase family protein [Dehalococcoidia bacterium]
MSNLDWRRKISAGFVAPITKVLARTPLTPNAITYIGFILICVAAALVANRQFLWGGIGVLVASAMDAFDGALARHIGKASRFGAVLDSTLDRLSEGVVLLSVIYVLARDGMELGVVLGGATLLLSLSVSYIRARAESVGVECVEGWFTRTERVIVIALGLILNQIIIAMAIVAMLSLITAAQRLYVVWRKLQSAK